MITCSFENGISTNLRHVVVHALAEKNGEILLVKRAPGILEAGKWGLPAGYMDRDETAVTAVVRELYEETGWRGEVVNLFRINSRPDRPHEDRQNVAIEFIVRPLEKTGTPDWEQTEVKWFPLNALPPEEEIAFDHGVSITLFKKFLKKRFVLPLSDW